MVSSSWAKVLQSPVLVMAVLLGAACQRSADGKTAFTSEATRPDVLPVMLNKDLPFHYPPALYAEKTQGNVTLRLYVDKDGIVVNDSTHVVESSKVSALDSAAVKGARDLRFVPAKLHGVPLPVSILFPVYFRHPEAPPPPGDTLLRKVSPPGAAPQKP
jgi:TonB family protein